MSNIPYPTEPIPIILSDGKERHLRYTLRAMRILKEKFGASLLAGGISELDEDRLPALIAAGLIEQDLTTDQVEDLVDTRALTYLVGQVVKAFAGDTPKPKQEADRPTEAAPETVTAIH